MKDKKNKLENLELMLIEELKVRIESGKAKSADLNVARQLLKDNGIESDVRQAGSPLIDLVDNLPFEEDNKKQTTI